MNPGKVEILGVKNLDCAGAANNGCDSNCPFKLGVVLLSQSRVHALLAVRSVDLVGRDPRSLCLEISVGSGS